MDSRRKKVNPREIDEKAILERVAALGAQGVYTSSTPRNRAAEENVTEHPDGIEVPPEFSEKEMQDYISRYLGRFRSQGRKSLHLSSSLHRRISALVWAAGSGEATVAGFVNHVLEEHFRKNEGLIKSIMEKYYQSVKP